LDYCLTLGSDLLIDIGHEQSRVCMSGIMLT
jgi:hypothetical protein